MSKIKSAGRKLGAIVQGVGIAFAVAISITLGFLLGLVVRTALVAWRFLPYLIIIGICVWVLSGCVYQPINVEVFVPTTAYVGGDVTLDASKAVQNVK
ncbi:hypothetical protein [Pseudomonas phage Bertil]|uniref:Uncharacterized protein n=1 Tax=Pseudomonas phage Bertil TaxID=2801385 RepID=A0A7T8EQJ8_9CAUD|nr:hypothetical protein [Pseudomonas phage Bertil]QQO90878.1 hypothetical protein [Pseudomonas phage Strit]